MSEGLDLISSFACLPTGFYQVFSIVFGISDQEDTWERADRLLCEMGRVERVQVRLGHQMKIWYLNLTRKNQETLRKMGFPDLLKESVEVDMAVGGKG